MLTQATRLILLNKQSYNRPLRLFDRIMTLKFNKRGKILYLSLTLLVSSFNCTSLKQGGREAEKEENEKLFSQHLTIN